MTTKTNRTKEQVQATKSEAERILARGRSYKTVGKLSLDGIVSKDGIMYDDLRDGAPTPDAIADAASEKAWNGLIPEGLSVAPKLRIVGETAVGAHVQVQSISTEQAIPVHVQHAEVA